MKLLFWRKPAPPVAEPEEVFQLMAPFEDYKVGETLEEQFRFWEGLLNWTKQPETRKFFAIQQKELTRLYSLVVSLGAEEAGQAAVYAARLKQQDQLTQFPMEVAKRVLILRKKLTEVQ